MKGLAESLSCNVGQNWTVFRGLWPYSLDNCDWSVVTKSIIFLVEQNFEFYVYFCVFKCIFCHLF